MADITKQQLIDSFKTDSAFSWSDATGMIGEAGLTKREYIIIEMMKALISNPARFDYIVQLVENGGLDQNEASRKNAKKAVYLADALIEAMVPEVE